jgi:predicted nucleic acid-binding protein
MNLVADGKVELLYSLKIIDEYKQVLAYEKFKFDIEKQKSTLEEIVEIGVELSPLVSIFPFDKDESDRIFYDAAKSGDAVLITGNLKHYPTEPFVMTPTDFIKSRHDKG